jgi:uncharacterized membrane protein YfcA
MTAHESGRRAGPLTLTLVASALIIAVASFVMGLSGFGIGLVALAFLPFVMSPVIAIVLTTLYALVFSVVILAPLRREIEPVRLTQLLIGTVLGTPLGVWGLAVLPATVINRMIGVVLVAITALGWWRLTPRRLSARGWGYGAGVLAGVLGGAVGTPGPPVILYAAGQEWSPRAVKANLLAFFIVNQAVILAGYWWTNLLDAEVLRLAAWLALPALIGVAAGVALFNRIDAVRFRRIVFAVLFVSGVVLLLRG